MRRVLSIVLFLCIALAAGPALASDTPKTDGVKNLDAAWTRAMLAGDAAAVAALYADDAVLVIPGAPAARGAKAIAESFAALLKDTKVTEIVLMDKQYRTGGHLVAGWGRYKMTMVPKAGGAPMTDTGTYCGVAREKNGVWKYVSDKRPCYPRRDP